MYDPCKHSSVNDPDTETIFVDYLSSIAAGCNGYAEKLHKVIKSIENNTKSDARINQKYRLVAAYLRTKLLTQKSGCSNSISRLNKVLLELEVG